MTNDPFLPEGATVPEPNSGYYKFESGENRFRIVGSAIVGYELWIDGKPVRRPKCTFSQDELRSADVNKWKPDQKKTPEYFWAFPVYNYKTGTVQILEVKQVTILRDINTHLEDEDFGRDPKKYDFVVTQFEGANKKIQYSTRAKPPKPLDEDVVQLVEEALKGIDVKAMYDGENPFSAKNEEESVFDQIAQGIEESRRLDK